MRGLARARDSGNAAEAFAASYLEAAGFCIVSRNFRRRMGELDLIGRRRDLLVIAEVRTRSSEEYGGAAASVSAGKQRRIRRAAALLLQQHKALAALRVRYDVIVVHDPLGEHPRVEWLQHAFSDQLTSRP